METIFNACIAGHANSGKTTLLRCLTKRQIGQVRDEAGTTVVNMYESGNKISAQFTDTPGFESPGKVLVYYEEFPDTFLDHMEKRGLGKEIEIIKALKEADVVYYVVPMDIVPQPLFFEELTIIKHFCNNIIGIINKCNIVREAVKKNYKNQWYNFFNDHGIQFMEYDLYWDSPEKQIELYNKSIAILDDAKQNRILEQIEKIKISNQKKRREIASEIIKCIERYSKLNCTFKSEYNHGKLSDEQSKRMITDAYDITLGFIRYLGMLNGVSVDEDLLNEIHLHVDKISKEMLESAGSKRTKNILEGIATGAITGAAGGTMSALSVVFGYGVVLSLGAFFAIPAAIGVVGALAGGTYKASQSQDPTIEYTFKLSDDDLFLLTNQLIASIWAISYFGFEYQQITDNKKDRIQQLMNKDIPEIFKKNNVNINNFRELSKINCVLEDLQV